MLRFGANSAEVLDRLRWLGGEFFTTMQVAVRGLADHDLKPLMAQALHMGDELHNRNAAASSLLFKRLTLALLDVQARQRRHPARARLRRRQRPLLPQHLDGGVQVDVDAAHGVPGSSMVTVMARNGVNFGIRLSGTGDQWFQAPANPVDGLYFPGYSVEDAAADLGDSAITETNGLGRLRDGGVPGDRAVRRRHAGRRHRQQPADAVASRWAAIRRSRCRRSTSAARPPGSTRGWWSTPACCRSSTPASRTGRPASARSAPGITTAPMECFDEAIAALAAT